MNGPGSTRARGDLAVAALIVAAVAAIYAQTAGFELTSWDDEGYVSRNPRVRAGLSWASVLWAFTTLESSNWHPLTWLSYLLDSTLFGSWAGGYHLSSVLWHAATCLLLYALLRRLTREVWRPALVALLFAVHPLHVESVAWVSERKDVLSAAFGLIALHAYVTYARSPSPGRYLLVALAFACSLLSKQMLVTLPAVLLLVDYWPLRRWDAARWPALVAEKLPLLALAAGAAAMTVIAQSAGGAVRTLDELSFAARLANAVSSYGVYLVKHAWPSELMFFQVFREPSAASASVAAASLLVVSVLAYRARERYPAFIVGWLWFLGTLVPVIGIVQVGDQAWASRYAYFPSIGLFVMVAWALPSPDFRRDTVRSTVVMVACAAVTVALALRAFVETTHWRSSETLYARALALNPGNFVAHSLIAAFYAERGARQLAERHANAAVQSSRGSGVATQTALITLSRVFMDLGRLDAAQRALDLVERMNPALPILHYNRGTLQLLRGDPQASLSHFDRAIALKPGYSEALNNRGAALARLARLEEAIDAHRRAASADPYNFQAHYNLGVALEASGRAAEALPAFERAAAVAPHDTRSRLKAAALLKSAGRLAEARALYRAVLAIDPSNPIARLELAP